MADYRSVCAFPNFRCHLNYSETRLDDLNDSETETRLLEIELATEQFLQTRSEFRLI